MTTSLASFLARIALCAATIATCASSMTARAAVGNDISFINQQGLSISGKMYSPSGSGPFPAVIMMHGCAGVFSYSDPSKGIGSLFTEWADRLVNAGYVAVLVDSFTPRNAPQNQCGNGATGVSELNDRPIDAIGAFNFLASQSHIDATRVGLLGWSHGASSTLATIERSRFGGGSNPFRAAVAFYPGCGLYNAFGGISQSTWMPGAPTTILHGTEDDLYKDGRCATRVNRAIQQGAVGLSLTPYTGARHSFDLAKSATGSFTISDVSAKLAGDSAALALFNSKLR